jgi:hypothetical protein
MAYNPPVNYEKFKLPLLLTLNFELSTRAYRTIKARSIKGITP